MDSQDQFEVQIRTDQLQHFALHCRKIQLHMGLFHYDHNAFGSLAE